MHYRQSFFCTLSNSLLICLCGKLFTSRYFYSGAPLVVSRRAWNVLRKFSPLRYEKVIASSPRRIKDKLITFVYKLKIMRFTGSTSLDCFAWRKGNSSRRNNSWANIHFHKEEVPDRRHEDSYKCKHDPCSSMSTFLPLSIVTHWFRL